MQYGKRLKKAYESIDTNKVYSLEEAVAAVKAGATAKFDETIDIAVRLGVDPRQSDQMVRGAVSLPAGTGKTLRVAVFAKGPKAEEARKAQDPQDRRKRRISKYNAGFRLLFTSYGRRN